MINNAATSEADQTTYAANTSATTVPYKPKENDVDENNQVVKKETKANGKGKHFWDHPIHTRARTKYRMSTFNLIFSLFFLRLSHPHFSSLPHLHQAVKLLLLLLATKVNNYYNIIIINRHIHIPDQCYECDRAISMT